MGQSEVRGSPCRKTSNACSGSGEVAWSHRDVPMKRQRTSEVGTSWFRLLQCAARATRGVSIRDGVAHLSVKRETLFAVQRPDGAFAETKGRAGIRVDRSERLRIAPLTSRDPDSANCSGPGRLPHRTMMVIGRKPVTRSAVDRDDNRSVLGVSDIG